MAKKAPVQPSPEPDPEVPTPHVHDLGPDPTDKVQYYQCGACGDWVEVAARVVAGEWRGGVA